MQAKAITELMNGLNALKFENTDFLWFPLYFFEISFVKYKWNAIFGHSLY